MTKLTDERIAEISYACGDARGPRIDNHKFARAIEAELAQQAEPVAVSVVGEIVIRDALPQVRWTIEGGIHALERGEYLLVASEQITGEDGNGEVYTTPPPSAPDTVQVPRCNRRIQMTDEWLEAEKFEAWWLSERPELGVAHKFTAWNAWLARARKVPAALQQAPAPDGAYGYARRLAESIWEKHYKTVAPNWVPLSDLTGVLTQIDNMTCGLTRAEQAPTQEPPTKGRNVRCQYHVCDEADAHDAECTDWSAPAQERQPMMQNKHD